MNRAQPQPQANDVWSNMNTPILPYNNNPHHNNSQQQQQRMVSCLFPATATRRVQFQQHGMKNRNSSNHERSDTMKRPSSAGQQPSGTSA